MLLKVRATRDLLLSKVPQRATLAPNRRESEECRFRSVHAPRGHFEVLSEKRDAIGLVVIVLILGRPTAADVVTPREVKFEFEVTDDQVAKACHLLVLMVNYPNPEAVNFKVVFTFEKRTDHSFYGFIVDVGDAHYRNGQFAGMEHVPLDAAEFLSPTFNSTGRFHMNVGDSGVFGSTADLETASAFCEP